MDGITLSMGSVPTLVQLSPTVCWLLMANICWKLSSINVAAQTCLLALWTCQGMCHLARRIVGEGGAVGARAPSHINARWLILGQGRVTRTTTAAEILGLPKSKKEGTQQFKLRGGGCENGSETCGRVDPVSAFLLRSLQLSLGETRSRGSGTVRSS
ncbi:Hypothetical predicted protein [Podarcis lilfordi]|uniref:Uncharacterized protein n=1 Tax=Podarcis lilfordi TaxID=74358 RepID=A0AA35KPB2_9SAUR|nr:Hypothetical predicted protein [Podarcis lilfordi]